MKRPPLTFRDSRRICRDARSWVICVVTAGSLSCVSPSVRSLPECYKELYTSLGSFDIDRGSVPAVARMRVGESRAVAATYAFNSLHCVFTNDSTPESVSVYISTNPGVLSVNHSRNHILAEVRALKPGEGQVLADGVQMKACGHPYLLETCIDVASIVVTP